MLLRAQCNNLVERSAWASPLASGGLLRSHCTRPQLAVSARQGAAGRGPRGITSARELIKVLRLKGSPLERMAKEVYRQFGSRTDEVLRTTSATEFLLQVGEGTISDGATGRPVLRVWLAWRVWHAYTLARKRNSSPLPPEMLRQLPRIFDNPAEASASLKRQQALFMTFLATRAMRGCTFQPGLDESTIMKLLLLQLREDPWALMMHTFSFEEMDITAKHFDADFSQTSRGAAAVFCQLNEATKKEESCNWVQLSRQANKVLQLDTTDEEFDYVMPLEHCVAEHLDDDIVLQFSKVAVRPSRANSQAPWAAAQCFLGPVHDAQIKITGFLHAIVAEREAEREQCSNAQPSDNSAPQSSATNAVPAIESSQASAEKKLVFGKLLNDKQIEAVHKAMSERVLLISGAAGCGKTLVIRAIVQELQAQGGTVYLLAPTGRAASNLRLITQKEAHTIHRYLNAQQSYDRLDTHFTFGGMLLEGTVIVDEASMVDTCLLAEILKTVRRTRATLILVGDPNQLSPVACGEPFLDLLAWSSLPHVHLDKVYRQEAGSGIIEAAHEVLRGDSINPLCMPLDVFEEVMAAQEPRTALDHMQHFGVDDDSRYHALRLAEAFRTQALWIPIPQGSDESIAKVYLAEVAGYLKAKGAEFQVVSPATGWDFELNVYKMNLLLHGIMSKTKDKGAIGFLAGDRVIQMENNSDLNVYNADVGVVEEVQTMMDADQQPYFSVTVKYSPRPNKSEPHYVSYDVYSEQELKASINHAWDISVHKAQGGSFPIVVLFLHESMRGNLNKRMLYTAVTRASSLLLILATEGALTPREFFRREESTLLRRLRGGYSVGA